MNKRIGIIGGGQLAMMMAEASRKLGYCNIKVLENNSVCPASSIGVDVVIGDKTNKKDIIKFAKNCDVLTIDIENVDIKGLKEATKYCDVYPNPSCLEIIQDKYKQKSYIKKLDIKVPNFYEITKYKFNENTPFILKSKKGGYDGKGVWLMNNRNELDEFISFNNLNLKDFFIEDCIDIQKELAVIAYMNNDKVYSYPIVETIQEDGICKEVIVPTPIDLRIRNLINSFTEKIVKSFDTRGVFGIEYFYDGSNIYLNEVSPRVHNSGHYTIEATNCSQFEQHMRSILKIKCLKPEMNVDSVKMVNVLGSGKGGEFELVMNEDNLHWYNKEVNGNYRENRKIGHYTKILDITSQQYPLVYVIMGSMSDLEQMKPCINLLNSFNVPIMVDVVSAHRTPNWMFEFGMNVESWCGKVVIAAAGGAAHLPGMVASLTKLPVIGVPIATKNLGGQDSLYSIVQMPDGVPVATVGIGKSKNAAILAMRILGMTGPLKNIFEKNEEKVKKQREMIEEEYID